MFAHQGGWDETLLVVGPILLITGLLLVVRKRVGNLPPPGEPPADRPGA